MDLKAINKRIDVVAKKSLGDWQSRAMPNQAKKPVKTMRDSVLGKKRKAI